MDESDHCSTAEFLRGSVTSTTAALLPSGEHQGLHAARVGVLITSVFFLIPWVRDHQWCL
jgi:hypothetical protein